MLLSYNKQLVARTPVQHFCRQDRHVFIPGKPALLCGVGGWLNTKHDTSSLHLLTKPTSVCSASAHASAGHPGPKPALQPLAGPGNGVFLLMLLNVVVFIMDHLLHLPFIKALYLNHHHTHWWQFITHMFCHASFQHLSSNLFHLCIFGKLVEETEGGFGVWFVYLITGLGAALASFVLTPALQHGRAVVSVGASGAVFGLFAVSVLSRLKLDFKRLLEAAVLGQFVIKQVLEEARQQVGGGLVLAGHQVSHVAHLGGALAGVLLVLLLHQLPDPDQSVNSSSKTL